MTAPQNWIECKLSEVVVLNPPKPAKSFLPENAPVSFLPMAAVSAESGTITGGETRAFGKCLKGYTAFSDGDVIFAKITPCMENGKSAVIESLTNGLGFGSTEFHVLRPSPVLSAHFLHSFIRQVKFRKEAAREMRGAVGQKRVPPEYLADHSIPLPPLPEQHRIVAKIEELFSELDAGIESLRKAKEQLKTYRQSVLDYAISNNKGKAFPTVTLRSVIESIGQGWSPKCENEPAPIGTWAVIKTTSVQSLAFIPEENKRLPDKLKPRPRLVVSKDDILITRAGPRNRVGVCCMVKKDYPKLIVCDKVYRLLLKKDRVLPGYLEIVLNSPSLSNKLNELKTGISDSGVNLTQGRFLDLGLPLPDIEKQEKIVFEIESRLSVADNLEKTIDAALSQADALRQSILKRAFEGKLVPQDPNDEPATALLERIKKEKDKKLLKKGLAL